MSETVPPSVHSESASISRTSEKLLRALTKCGWVLFAVWAVTLVTWGVVRPDPYAQGWRLVLELAFLGRLVNIADGAAPEHGFSNIYLFIQSGPQDVILLLIVYPLFVRAYKGSGKKGIIGGTLERIRRTAERHKAVVEPFGAIGLWAFVFFPFWSTGVLVGGLVGYLLGLRAVVTFSSVLLGHFISVVVLIFFFDATYEAAESFSESGARFIPWIVLVLVLTLGLVGRLRDRRRTTKSDRT